MTQKNQSAEGTAVGTVAFIYSRNWLPRSMLIVMKGRVVHDTEDALIPEASLSGSFRCMV